MNEIVLSAHAQTVIAERGISLAWVRLTISDPDAEMKDRDDSALTHAIRAIPEFGNRKLRVIVNKAENPPRVITAYFDRTLKE